VTTVHTLSEYDNMSQILLNRATNHKQNLPETVIMVKV